MLAALAALATACGASDRTVRLARLDAERAALDRTFDALEERMLATQARVHFWQEMKERHAGVTALACQNQDAHARGMALHALPPEPARPRSLAGRRLASAAGPAKRPAPPRPAPATP
ncbi:MAG: hypothetical protein QM704_04820 [Anaeromyxobacteraceae bacterium]